MSVMKVGRAAAVIPVRRRLINAVFFFREESRDLLTGKRSREANSIRRRYTHGDRGSGGVCHTTLARPSPLI